MQGQVVTRAYLHYIKCVERCFDVLWFLTALFFKFELAVETENLAYRDFCHCWDLSGPLLWGHMQGQVVTKAYLHYIKDIKLIFGVIWFLTTLFFQIWTGRWDKKYSIIATLRLFWVTFVRTYARPSCHQSIFTLYQVYKNDVLWCFKSQRLYFSNLNWPLDREFSVL
jgi:hypothetical protein